MKLTDIIGQFVVIVMSITCGFILLFYRNKVIAALMASNKEFWNKFNCNSTNGIEVLLANVLIPLMGLCFLVLGIIGLIKFVVHVLL